MSIVPTKGSLTVVETGQRVPFMFNPTNVGSTKAISYAEQLVPGVSDPVIQYAAGGVRTISMELYLDGDRGRNRPRPLNAIRQSDNLNAVNIADEIQFYQSLLYPIHRDGTRFTDVYPPTVLFSFGPLYQGVPCVVSGADDTVTFWTPDLRPIRATIRLELKEKRARGRERGQIYQDASNPWQS